VPASSSAFAKLFFIRYTDLGGDRPLKPDPNFWHLTSLAQYQVSFAFFFPPCHLPNYSVVGF